MDKNIIEYFEKLNDEYKIAKDIEYSIKLLESKVMFYEDKIKALHEENKRLKDLIEESKSEGKW